MHMSTTTRDQYLDPYREAHDDHGSDFRVTLWANERSQRLRPLVAFLRAAWSTRNQARISPERTWLT